MSYRNSLYEDNDMALNRRKMLKWGISGAGVLALGAGTRLVAQSNKRQKIERDLIRAASTHLASRTNADLSQLPVLANESIKRFIHGVCLNVAPFVDVVCSNAFSEKLSDCGSDDDRHRLLTETFERRLVSENAVIHRVDLVARTIGKTLDANWLACCRGVAEDWQVVLEPWSGPSIDTLPQTTERVIRRELRAVRNLMEGIEDRPSLSDTATSIGLIAIKLLPVARVSPKLALPAFLVLALKPVWRFVLSRLLHRPADYVRSITSRLAGLGNDIGRVFESTVKDRIADLHAWQDQSLRTAAAHFAEESVPLFL